jgi:hypothetical protein
MTYLKRFRNVAHPHAILAETNFIKYSGNEPLPRWCSHLTQAVNSRRLAVQDLWHRTRIVCKGVVCHIIRAELAASKGCVYKAIWSCCFRRMQFLAGFASAQVSDILACTTKLCL